MTEFSFDAAGVDKSSGTPDALDLELRLVTIAVFAAKLARYLPRGADPVLCVLRLIARGSLPFVMVAGQVRLSLDALADFLKNGAANAKLRATLGYPVETLSPIFSILGNWFDAPWSWPLSTFAGQVYGELDKQVPTSKMLIDGAKNQPKGFWEPSWEPALNRAAEITPAIRAIVGAPIPASNPILPARPDASAFGGIAEIWLAAWLQTQVQREIERRAVGNYQNILPQDVGQLYRSPEAYKSIVDVAITEFEAGSYFTVTRLVGQNAADAKTLLPAVRVVISLKNTTLVELAGTNIGRLACLAL